MRDIDRRSVADKSVEALVKLVFGESVKCGGRLVKNYHIAALVKRSCKGKLLLFAA